jgi:cytochrome c1
MKKKSTRSRKAPTAAQKAAAAQKRAELAALSRQIKKAIKSGMLDAATVNEGLELIYRSQTGQNTFHTFAGWKAQGKGVKKGEHGFPIWGAPRKSKGAPEQAEQNTQTEPGEEGFSFFPIAYLFHAGQVETATERAYTRQLAA